MRRAVGILQALIVAGLLLWLNASWFEEYLTNSGRLGWYTDDVRNLIGFFAYENPGAFTNDYIGGYSRAQSPFLHRWIMWAFAQFGLVREATQFGPPILLVLTSLMAGRAGYVLGRWPGAFITASLV